MSNRGTPHPGVQVVDFLSSKLDETYTPSQVLDVIEVAINGCLAAAIRTAEKHSCKLYYILFQRVRDIFVFINNI